MDQQVDENGFVVLGERHRRSGRSDRRSRKSSGVQDVITVSTLGLNSRKLEAQNERTKSIKELERQGP